MANYRLRTDVSWAQTKHELAATFRKWRVNQWEVSCASSPRSTDSWQAQPVEDRRVEVMWTGEGGRIMRLALDTQTRNIDNLRALYLAIESIRLNEHRGVSGQLMHEAYKQIAAPTAERDPWQVLGLTPGADLDTVRAVYRSKVKKVHPDLVGGPSDPAAFKELTRAYEAIMGEAA